MRICGGGLFAFMQKNKEFSLSALMFYFCIPKLQKESAVFTVFLKYYLDDNSESSIITLTDGILHSAVI